MQTRKQKQQSPPLATKTPQQKAAKTKAIKSEIKRLNAIYKDIPEERLKSAESLIYDAADLRLRIKETQQDLDDNGYDTMFQQTIDVAPYERERPAAKRLIALQKNLLAIMKELNGYLPKPELKTKEEDDGFDDFVNDR